LTHAEWISKGEAICSRLNAELAADSVKSQREFGRALPQAAADERAEAIELAALVPPKIEAAGWQQFLTSTQQWSENSAKLGEAARAGIFNTSLPLFRETEKLHAYLTAIVRHDGFKECALL
jgi:hypothetical protein